MIRAFLTGSHAYGQPTKRSDIDLVVLVSQATLDKLQALCDDSDDDEYYKNNRTSAVRFGKLNLLCCTDPIAFLTWHEGTRALIEDGKEDGEPLTREDACAFFRRLEEHRGLHKEPPRPGQAEEDDGDEEETDYAFDLDQKVWVRVGKEYRAGRVTDRRETRKGNLYRIRFANNGDDLTIKEDQISPKPPKGKKGDDDE